MGTSWSGRWGTLAAPALLCLTPVRAANQQAGILWETTSETVIEGMPMKMPPRTVQMCAARQWTHPPANPDQHCTTSNFQQAGSKVTWTVQCTGEMTMTGAGEINFEGDGYTGAVKFTADQMKMTVNLRGRKLGGCDNPQ